MYIVRVATPVAPAAKFPLLKLASSDYSPNSQDEANNLASYFHAIGWTVIDLGPDTEYYVHPVFSCYVPNGYHVEFATHFPFDRAISQSYPAIVPDGKSRSDLGV